MNGIQEVSGSIPLISTIETRTNTRFVRVFLFYKENRRRTSRATSSSGLKLGKQLADFHNVGDCNLPFAGQVAPGDFIFCGLLPR